MLQQPPRRRCRFVNLTVVLTLLCGTPPAWSASTDQGGATAAKAAAEGLFDEGVALSERGDYAAACPKFEASEALDPAVGTLLYLADCYERVGRTASAWVRFREARSLAEAQGMPDRARIAGTRASSLETKLARATINVSEPAAPELEVRVGSTRVPSGSWGTALPMDSGDWTVVVNAPGYETYTTQLRVPPGPASVVMNVPPLRRQSRLASSPAGGPRKSGTEGSVQRFWGGTTAVVGVLGLGTAGVLAVLSKQRNDESFDHCRDTDRNVCSASGLELREDARTFADVATVSLAAGGALLATGAVLYLSAPTPAGRGSLTLAPTFASSAFGFSARGEY